MKTSILLTIDTEPSVAGAFDEPEEYQPLFDEPVWGHVDEKSQGLGFIVETLGWYSQKATFFVETASADFFGEEPMRKVCEMLKASGQDVQLHLHPCWRVFRGGSRAAEATDDQCAELDEALLEMLITEGCDRVEQWVGCRPIALRTGNFSAGRKVYRAMARADLKYSSNICIGVAQSSEGSLNLPGGIFTIEGIRELPASCFLDIGPIGRGRWRPLQITACSFSEIRGLLEQAFAAGQTHVVLVTHPFEFVKAADMRYSSIKPNRLIQHRLRKMCAYVAANSDRFEMRSFADLQEGELVDSTLYLAGDPWHGLLRAVQNALNDRISLL